MSFLPIKPCSAHFSTSYSNFINHAKCKISPLRTPARSEFPTPNYFSSVSELDPLGSPLPSNQQITPPHIAVIKPSQNLYFPIG